MCVAPFYMDNVTGILQPGESLVTACGIPYREAHRPAGGKFQSGSFLLTITILTSYDNVEIWLDNLHVELYKTDNPNA